MKVAPIFEVKENLSRFVSELGKGPVLITKNGKPCAALIQVGEDDLEAFLLAHHPRFMSLIDGSYARPKEQGGVSFSEIENRVRKGRRKPAI